jgi:hypothetical protein
MLAILVVQYGLHSVSHLIDVGDSDPSWNGPVVLAFEVGVTALLAALLVRERRAQAP